MVVFKNMKYAYFIIFFLLLSCDLESGLDSISKTANSIIDKATQQGGVQGIATLEVALKKSKQKVSDLQDDLEDAEDDLEDAEDDLEDKKRELREVNARLSDPDLTAEERQRLEREAEDLQNNIDTLTQQVSDKQADIDRLTQQVSDKEDEITQLNTAKAELESERDCWKKTKLSLCDRAQAVQDKVLESVSEISDCNDIHYCHLENITTLDLSGIDGYFNPSDGDCNSHLLSLKPSDFYGLTGLENLDLSGNCLKGLSTYEDSTGFFSTLNSLKRVNISDSEIDKLSKGFFNGVIDTLDDGGVGISDFIYCADPVVPYLSKLGSDKTPHNHRDYRGIDTSAYCFP